jgi:hypothetical protein
MVPRNDNILIHFSVKNVVMKLVMNFLVVWYPGGMSFPIKSVSRHNNSYLLLHIK